MFKSLAENEVHKFLNDRSQAYSTDFWGTEPLAVIGSGRLQGLGLRGSSASTTPLHRKALDF
jgi:hypothetical protein